MKVLSALFLTTAAGLVSCNSPPADSSKFRNDLTFLHEANFHVGYSPRVNTKFSPDGQSIATIDREGQLVLVSMEMGEVQLVLKPKRGVFEYTDYFWSPDGKYFILRDDGSDISYEGTAKGITTGPQSRIRTFLLPEYSEIAQADLGDLVCQSSPFIKMTFDADGILWAPCDQSFGALPDYPFAIALSLPHLEVLSVHRYEQSAEYRSVLGFFLSKGDYWAWQGAYGNDFRFHNLSAGHNPVTIKSVRQSDLAGDLNFEPDFSKPDEGNFILQYTGIQDQTSNILPDANTRRSHGAQAFVRRITIDLEKERVVSFEDLATRDLQKSLGGSRNQFDLAGPYKIVLTKPSLKKGAALSIVDDQTGSVRKSVQADNQKLVAVSPDEQWLITQDSVNARLLIYKLGTSLIDAP